MDNQRLFIMVQSTLYQQTVDDRFYPQQHQNIHAVCQLPDKKVITSDKTVHPELLTCCYSISL